MPNLQGKNTFSTKYFPVLGVLVAVIAGFIFPSLKPVIFVLLLVAIGALLSARWGAIAGTTITFLGSGSLILLLSTVSFLIAFPLVLVADIIFLAVAIGVGILVVFTMRPGVIVEQKLRYFSIAVGPALVILTAIIGRLGDSFPVMSWVMRGDSANNLVFAWKIFSDNGIDLTYRENPVPLPADFIAFFAALQHPEGRTQFVFAALTALALVWTVLIATTSLLLALVVDHVSAGWIQGSRASKAILVIFASLVPLSWLFSGYLLESGFFGAQIAILILLSSWALITSSQRVWPVALGLYGAALLTLMTWSPLTLAVAILLGLHIVRNWKVLALDVKRALIQALIVVVIGLIAFTATLPSFTERSDWLANAVGGIHTFDHIITPILFTLEVGFAAVLYIRGSRMFALYSVAFLSAIFVGLLFLLLLRRGEDTLWAYYQLKYEWFFLIMLICVGLVLIAKLIAPIVAIHWREKTAWSILAVATVATLVVLPGGNTTQAIVANFAGQTLVMEPGREEPDGVFNSFWEAFNQDQPTVLWGSENPDEFFVDFWLLQQHSDDILDPLRGLAYSQDLKDMNQLCQISTQLGDSPQVWTKDPTLEEKFRAQCPENSATQFVLQ